MSVRTQLTPTAKNMTYLYLWPKELDRVCTFWDRRKWDCLIQDIYWCRSWYTKGSGYNSQMALISL